MRWLLVGLIVFVGCSDSAPDSSPSEPEVDLFVYQPPERKNDGLSIGHASDYGLDVETITQMMDAIAERFPGVDSVGLIKNQHLVFEAVIRNQLDAYDQNVGNRDLAHHSMQSVSKSVVSALIGIAVDKGLADINRPFLEYFPQYESIENLDQKKAQMTLEDVLTMRHGLLWDEWSFPFNHPNNSLNDIYGNHQDYVKGFLDLPMSHEPGTFFAYSTIASVAVGAVFEELTEQTAAEFAQDHLFEPLQIDDAIWIETPAGRTHTGGGLHLSLRAMLKFGLLFLNGGNWQGQQLISRDWVEKSTTRVISFASGNPWTGYGYHWWQNSFPLQESEVQVIQAEGNGGQFIFIVPEFEMVVVFTGSHYNSQLTYQPLELMGSFILPALVK